LRNEKAKIFDSILNTIENEDIRHFAEECIETIPDYFWEVGASSTGKYHPQYALGELGLARHTCALVRFLNHILNVDCFGDKFTSREKDLMRVAGMMHDTRKSGDDADYAKNKYTKFDHPLLAANEIRSLIGFISPEELEIVATTIESHMGQWNTDKRSPVVLPLPTNKYQKMVHLADYLASRKDIEVLFDGFEAPKKEIVKLEDYVLNFGKHSGEKLVDVAQSDPSYISWAKENMNREPIKSLLAQL
jgi:hypothetical protein